MRFCIIEATEVAIHNILTGFANVSKLRFIAAHMRDISNIVVLVLIYKFCHIQRLAHRSEAVLSEPDFKKRPPTPHRNYGGSGSWNQTYVVTVI